MYREELQKLGVEVNLAISRVFVDSMKEIGLFVVVRGEDGIVDDALQNLWKVSRAHAGQQRSNLQIEASVGLPRQPQYQVPVYNVCRHPDTCRRASQG